MFPIRKHDGFGGVLQVGRRAVNGRLRIGQRIAARMRVGPRMRNRSVAAKSRLRGRLETGFGRDLGPPNGIFSPKNGSKRPQNGFFSYHRESSGPKTPSRPIFLATDAKGAKKRLRCPTPLGELGALCENPKMASKWPFYCHFRRERQLAAPGGRGTARFRGRNRDRSGDPISIPMPMAIAIATLAGGQSEARR